MVRIRSVGSNFIDLIPLLSSRVLPLGEKGRLYQACVRNGLHMAVRLGQSKRRMSSNWIGMIQGRLHGCALIGLMVGFLLKNLGID